MFPLAEVKYSLRSLLMITMLGRVLPRISISLERPFPDPYDLDYVSPSMWGLSLASAISESELGLCSKSKIRQPDLQIFPIAQTLMQRTANNTPVPAA